MPKIAQIELEKRLYRLADAAVTELEAQLGVIAARREELPPGGFDKDLANAASAVGRALTGAVSELRQIEKHDHKVAKTPEQRFKLIREYLRGLDAEHRAIIRRDLDESGKDSVLS